MIESASNRIGRLGDVKESWKTEATARLASTADLLRAALDRFFLKTRLCLPFARKCEDEAKNLDALLAELHAQPVSGGATRLNAALDALEKAAKTLDERSLMQGMTIT
jgi:hypothetical protein